MHIERELERYFSASTPNHLPDFVECIKNFLRVWQEGETCKRHDHKFKRTLDLKCVDCAHEEIRVNWALRQLERAGKIHRILIDGEEGYVSGPKPVEKIKPVLPEGSPWSSGIVKALDDLMIAGNTSTDAARIINDRFGTKFSRNAVIGKWFRMQKKVNK